MVFFQHVSSMALYLVHDLSLPSSLYGLLFTVNTVLIVLLGIFTGLAVLMKRCHDRDRSGWYLLWGLIPIIGEIWLLIELGFRKGTEGRNLYGPDPLAGKESPGAAA